MSDIVEELSDTKRALLEQLLRGDAPSAPQERPAIKRAIRNGPVPLSFAQQQFWLLNQFAPDSPVYQHQTSIHLPDSLNVAALEQSLHELIQRHEAWRTSFPLIDGQPVQCIHPSSQFRLAFTDLSHLSAAEQELALHQLQEELGRPFDLTQAPPLRAQLVFLGPAGYRLFLALHHILYDGFALWQVFLPELITLYEACSAGRPSPLPALPIQYADYAIWERATLDEPTLAAHLAYWKHQLAGLPASLNLPTDHPRPRVPGQRGAHAFFTLPAPLRDALQVLSLQEGSTLFMTMLAAFATLLSRYSGQDDVVIGTPATRRAYPELQGLLGVCINTLPLRVDLSRAPGFRALLRQVRQMVLSSLDHDGLPFEELVKVLRPERSLGHNPLFQVMLTLEQPVPTLPPGWAIDEQASLADTAVVDLRFALENRPEGLVGDVEYDADLFEAATIERMIGHWQTLLEGIIQGPDRPLSALPLLGEAERHQLLVEWNATEVAYPKDQPVHRLFETQVERAPASVALVCGNRELRYGELNQRANQLAHYLRKQGVGPEVRVGLCMERSPEMVVSLLGILKAGAAYVPLDPTYPKERLAFMLEDAQVPMLLTMQPFLDLFPARGLKMVCLDRDWQPISEESDENLAGGATAEHLAYVMYTSGSTGRPKGVEIQHYSITRLVIGAAYADLDETKTLLHLSPISFDASTFELWGALLHGARCVLFPERIPTPRGISEMIDTHHVTTLWLTASLFNTVIDEAPEALKNARQVLTGGEALSVAHIQRALDALPLTQIINGYGPTESTTFTCCYPIPRPFDTTARSIPIGRPIANTRVYILDARLNPTPIGVPGELHIGGDGLARGYLNRPGLTEEKFIADPFSSRPGARLYKTGDVARWRPDGTIEFLGRLDHQVKIRGFRIEPEEVETILDQHPAVQESLVAALEVAPGEKRLVAYFVPKHQASAPSPGTLREWLRARLPEYMLPTALVCLERFPLTPAGKVDRQALPAPVWGGLASAQASGLPRTATEEQVAAIWRDLLHIEHVGIHANFFELGGHSLLATQVLSRIQAVFQVNLPLRALFAAPTIAGLAEQIEAARQQALGQHAPLLQSSARPKNLPLSFAQKRLWFLEQLSPGTPAYIIPMALRLEGPLNITALETSLQEVVRRHESLRTTFPTREGQPIQHIAASSNIPLPVSDLSVLEGDEQAALVQQWIHQESRQPFDLAQGPLVRARLLRLSEQEHILLLSLHHIVADGWSLSVLFSELAALYRGFATGAQAVLPALPVQYADYTLWQQQDEKLEQQLAYWREQLAHAPALLELPTDHPRPAVQRYQGADYHFTLPAGLVAQLQALSRQEQVTLFMTLLAAFQALLARYSGQQDIVVGTPIAGRTQPELEPLIGFLVNTLALRADLSGNPSFRELLKRVREVALSAYAHQDVPFEQVVEALQLERHLSYAPLFQVFFAWQNTPEARLDLPGVRVTPLKVENQTAKFDLSLDLAETTEGIAGTFEYDTALFERATIERLAGHFQTLLEGIVAAPEQALSDLPLLPAEERHQLLAAWNATQQEYPDQCLHTLFEAQADRTPEAIAVVYEGEYLTYRELNARANQLAHYLRSRGVKPEARVGICLERSLTLVIGLLGILKAGGAYVPLDPTYPKGRISFMLEDAQAEIVLTDTQVCSQLAAYGGNMVCLDSAWRTIARQSRENLWLEMRTDHPAYVIYTSGSTGKPKGVQVLHAAVVNFLESMRREPGITDQDTLLAVTTFSFDIAGLEVYLPLIVGACSVLVSRETASDGARLIAQLEATGATIMQATPATWRLLLNAGWSGKQQLKLLCGGEALSRELAHQLLPKSASLWNMYGPTETTIWSAIARVDEHQERIVIGRPIANTQVYLLDERQQPVPIGVPGELFIGGVGLARGYLNRPDLTAERFIPHPFSSAPGERLYRTGDAARYLPNGDIELLGRLDQQIKLRGFRIELGEIETALNQHPAVNQAVVIVHQDAPGNERLVAYMVADRAAIPPTAELRGFLKQYLPDYMVPSAFVQLEAFPLTPNGKIDRRALQARASARPEREGAGIPPRTALEQTLAGIWSEVLGVHQIGVYDTFFDLGGHSLLAAQVIARLREVFRIEVPLSAIFKAPSLAELAAALADFGIEESEPTRDIDSVAVEQPLPDRQPNPAAPQPCKMHPAISPPRRFPRDGALPLSVQQETRLLRDRQHGLTATNVSEAYQLIGRLDTSALEASLQEIVRRHEILRTTFSMRDGIPMQHLLPALSLRLPVIDLSWLPSSVRKETARHIVHEEAFKPFNLSQGPLVRAKLIRLEPERHQLVIALEHIISDGYSLGVFLRELVALYNAFSRGAPSPLPELPIQYVDFAAQQRQVLDGASLQRLLDYWRSQLGGSIPRTAFPKDYPRTAASTFRGASQSLQLSPELSDSLKRVGRQNGATLYMVLLAAFQTLAHRYTGKSAISTTTPVANRLWTETEALIGWLASVVNIRTEFSEHPGFLEVLKRVREASLGAYAHQELPYSQLMKLLEPQSYLNLATPTELYFDLVDTYKDPFEALIGLTAEPIDMGTPERRVNSINLLAMHEATGLHLVMGYEKDLYRSSTIACMLRNFQVLLEHIVVHPEQPVSLIPLANIPSA